MNYKYIHKNFSEWKIHPSPKRPEPYKLEYPARFTIEDNTTLLEIILECVKQNVRFEDCLAYIDTFEHHYYFNLHQRKENPDYVKEMTIWAKKMKEYEKELVILEDLKNQSLKEAEAIKKEEKLKLLKRLQEELGVHNGF